MSTLSSPKQPATHKSGFENLAEYNESPAGTDAGKLLINWFQSHARFLQKASQLVLADARLAAASGLQIAALTVAFSFVFVCTWIVINIGFALLLVWIGVSPGAIVGVILLLHLVTLVALSMAIRSTFEGLRFRASKTALAGMGEKQVTGRKRYAEDVNNE